MMLLRAAIVSFLGIGPAIATSGTAASSLSSSASLQDALLEKAVKLNKTTDKRNLEDYYDAGDDGGDNDDSYFNNADVNFQGYAMKFATCQNVQRFDTDAMQRGDYSPMFTDSIVVLRLCPKRSCSTSAQYGCSSGYGEYAIDLSDYVRIMMYYKDHKQKNFCAFCKACTAYGYYYTANNDNDYYTANDDTDDKYYNQANDDGGDDNANIQGFDTDTCYHYSQRCANVAATCQSDDDAAGEIDYISYIDYLGCQEIEGLDGSTLYMSPQCDSDTEKIAMGVFYDEYCSQSAGDSVNAESFTGVAFEDVMASTEDLECISCAPSNYPPFYKANNYVCNNIYKHSGKCDAYLSSDISNSQNYYSNNAESTESDTQCAFTEAIRLGTYDSEGKIYVSTSQKSSQKATVSGDQKASLIILGLVCAAFAMYSCFLHHEITNLLLKSLSSGLIKDSRNGSRRKSRSSSRSRRGSSRGRSASRGRKKKKFVPKSYSEDSTDGSASWT